ncbi:MAG: hypothetical protein EHM67_10355 [Hyphomicrobiaceae bacterium]|nr:MAG: hypothetical protein EHM67_10355 [Hyphomicrobiaceae bacterium]
MAAIDQIAAARDDEFAGRVAMIIFKVAQMVATEDTATANHDVRLDYALRNIRGEENPKLVGAHVISSNPTIAAAIDAEPELKGSNVPDADIEFALASIWDARSIAFAARGPTA